MVLCRTSELGEPPVSGVVSPACTLRPEGGLRCPRPVWGTGEGGEHGESICIYLPFDMFMCELTTSCCFLGTRHPLKVVILETDRQTTLQAHCGRAPILEPSLAKHRNGSVPPCHAWEAPDATNAPSSPTASGRARSVGRRSVSPRVPGPRGGPRRPPRHGAAHRDGYRGQPLGKRPVRWLTRFSCHTRCMDMVN